MFSISYPFSYSHLCVSSESAQHFTRVFSWCQNPASTKIINLLRKPFWPSFGSYLHFFPTFFFFCSHLNFSEGTALKGISHTGQRSNCSSINFLFMHFLQMAKRTPKIKSFRKSRLIQYLKENLEKIMQVKYTADINTKDKNKKIKKCQNYVPWNTDSNVNIIHL